MVREQGTVERVEGNKAVVRIVRSSACAACEARESCGEALGKDMIVEVANDLGAGVGDRIEIGIPGGVFLGLSLLVYLFPVAGLIGGAVGGGACGTALNVDPTAMSVAGACIGLCAVFYGLRRFDRLAGGRKGLRPRITRILRPTNLSPPGPQRSSPGACLNGKA